METQITRRIEDYLKTYMAMSDEQAFAVSLWVLHTWTFSDSFPRRPWTTPYLYVHSAEKQSGKTLLIDLLESLVLNPERAVDMTSSVLFRLIESVQPTLFIDEVDTIWSGAKNEAMRGVLNGGYKHGGYVWRTVPGPDGPEPQKFGTFSPKLLAGIDNSMLPDTIADRCIPIKLRRKRADDQRRIYYSFEAGPIAEQLANEINEWMQAHAEAIIDSLPEPMTDVSPRAFEIAMPLLQIARADRREKEARQVLASLLNSREERESEGTRLLRSILELFESRKVDRVTSAELLAHLGITHGKILGTKLRPYEIGPTHMFLVNGNKKERGYYRHQFEDAFARYL
jgi:putative DNA primase/helicase